MLLASIDIYTVSVDCAYWVVSTVCGTVVWTALICGDSNLNHPHTTEQMYEIVFCRQKKSTDLNMSL